MGTRSVKTIILREFMRFGSESTTQITAPGKERGEKAIIQTIEVHWHPALALR